MAIEITIDNGNKGRKIQAFDSFDPLYSAQQFKTWSKHNDIQLIEIRKKGNAEVILNKKDLKKLSVQEIAKELSKLQ